MRRLLPLSLLIVGFTGAGCAKEEKAASVTTMPPASTGPVSNEPASKIATVDLTPASMATAMDVPLYPGATAPDGLSSKPDKRTDGSTRYSLVLATKDAPAKVLAFYAKELGLEAKAGTVVGTTKKGNAVIVSAAPEAGRTLVRLKSIAYANK